MIFAGCHETCFHFIQPSSLTGHKRPPPGTKPHKKLFYYSSSILDKKMDAFYNTYNKACRCYISIPPHAIFPRMKNWLDPIFPPGNQTQIFPLLKTTIHIHMHIAVPLMPNFPPNQ